MSAEPKRKKTASSFKKDWLVETVITATSTSHDDQRVYLRDVFVYDENEGTITCLYCHDAMVSGEFSSGKKWCNNVWKLDFLKWHLKSKTHLYGVQKLRNKNSSLPAHGILKMLSETPEERNRKRACKEEILILIDNVLLAVKMNISSLSVQDINDHMAKYVRIAESWQSKNYAFEFLESTNVVISQEIMEEIASADFHTLTVDESTDIPVSKCLILYFNYRVFFEYKTRFGGIIQLKSCDTSSIVTAIEAFYKKYRLELHKMVMFTSDGAAVVMLGRRNGVATKLKERIPHLVQQHCIAHWEDLGVADTWKEVKLLQDIETLMRTIYSMFSRSTTNGCKF